MNEDPLPRSPGHARFLQARSERIRALRQALDDLYPRKADITFEIGCGHGHYLTAYAEAHPDRECLGIDLVSKRIRKACAKRDKRRLGNLRFLKAEIRECLSAMPDRLSLERILVLFPDPWPKKRHAKNRILQPGLLDELARMARPDAALHFRTDDPDNFAYGMDVIASHPRWIIQDDLAWPFENPSFFQELLGRYQSLTAVHSPFPPLSG